MSDINYLCKTKLCLPTAQDMAGDATNISTARGVEIRIVFQYKKHPNISSKKTRLAAKKLMLCLKNDGKANRSRSNDGVRQDLLSSDFTSPFRVVFVISGYRFFYRIPY